MPVYRLEVTTHSFPPELAVPATATIEVSRAKLIWAAVTVGKTSWFEPGTRKAHARAEAGMRVAMLDAAIVPDRSGRATRPATFSLLDGSEKGAISYFLGMTIAKLLAWEYLSVPYALHHSRYAVGHGVTHGVTKRRPDLFGMRARPMGHGAPTPEWVVLEAKGRSMSLSASERTKLEAAGKVQAQAVSLISGMPPVVRVVSIASFRRRRLEVSFSDPEGGEQGGAWEISPHAFLERYYEPLLAAVAEDDATSERYPGHRIATVAPGVRVGVPGWWLRRNPTLEDLSALHEAEGTEEGFYSGPDGVLIECDEPGR